MPHPYAVANGGSDVKAEGVLPVVKGGGGGRRRRRIWLSLRCGLIFVLPSSRRERRGEIACAASPRLVFLVFPFLLLRFVFPFLLFRCVWPWFPFVLVLASCDRTDWGDNSGLGSLPRLDWWRLVLCVLFLSSTRSSSGAASSTMSAVMVLRRLLLVISCAAPSSPLHHAFYRLKKSIMYTVSIAIKSLTPDEDLCCIGCGSCKRKTCCHGNGYKLMPKVHRNRGCRNGAKG